MFVIATKRLRVEIHATFFCVLYEVRIKKSKLPKAFVIKSKNLRRKFYEKEDS